MGHWEQIGANRRRRREEMANWPRWRRLDWFGYVMTLAAGLLWFVIIWHVGHVMGWW